MSANRVQGIAVCPSPRWDGSTLYGATADAGWIGTYQPSLRRQVASRVPPLTGWRRSAWSASSLLYVARRAAIGGRSPRAVAAQLTDVAGAARQGAGSCRRTWLCCEYCRHGIAMIAAGRYIAQARDSRIVRTHLTFTPADGEIVSAHALLGRAADVLDTLAAARPARWLSCALLAPSYSSSRGEQDGRLHVHALLDARIDFEELQIAASLHGVSWSAGDNQPDGSFASTAMLVSYVLAQVDERVYRDACFGATDARVRVWSPATPARRERARRHLARSGVLAQLDEARERTARRHRHKGKRRHAVNG